MNTKITYYLEVTSSWCFWAEPTWAQLKRRYEGTVDFEWKIAKMMPDGFPVSSRQYDWFLQRSSEIVNADFVPTSKYFEWPIPNGYPAASLVAEAARLLGAGGDETRLALSRAAYREGRHVGRMDVAVEIAAKAGRLDPAKLRLVAEGPEVASRIEQSTREFFAHQIAQRPAFVLTNDIGDKAVFSGVVRVEPLVAAIDALLGDAAAVAAHVAEHGDPPES